MVYVVNDGLQIVSCRSGNDNVFCAGIDVSLCFSFGGVESGTLQNYIYADLSPGKLSCVGHCIDFDLFSVNSDGILACCNGISQCISALCGIVFQ
mgnify:CR=1 FL=1